VGPDGQPLPPDPNDPDNVLTLQQRRLMNEDMEAARITYGERMRMTELDTTISNDEKMRRLSNLRNCFYTKQSMIRRHYGVRLRGARNKKFLEWERSNMDMSPMAISVAGATFKKLRTSLNGHAGAAPGGRPENEASWGLDQDRPRKVPAVAGMSASPSPGAAASHADDTIGNGLLPATDAPMTMVDPTVDHSVVPTTELPTVSPAIQTTEPSTEQHTEQQRAYSAVRTLSSTPAGVSASPTVTGSPRSPSAAHTTPGVNGDSAGQDVVMEGASEGGVVQAAPATAADLAASGAQGESITIADSDHTDADEDIPGY
jgi:hypothetical protein